MWLTVRPLLEAGPPLSEVGIGALVLDWKTVVVDWPPPAPLLTAQAIRPPATAPASTVRSRFLRFILVVVPRRSKVQAAGGSGGPSSGPTGGSSPAPPRGPWSPGGPGGSAAPRRRGPLTMRGQILVSLATTECSSAFCVSPST